MSDSLRVAFVDQTGDITGGAQESLALLLEHLPAYVTPELLLFNDGAYADRARALGVPVTIFPVSLRVSAATREAPRTAAFAALPAVFRLAALLRRKRADVVYTNTVKAHFIGALAARLAGVPAVAHLRDILDGNSRRALRMVLAGSTRRRIAISRVVDQTYRLARTKLIPNPVDLRAYARLPDREPARRTLGLPQGVPIVAIVGRINRWKRQDLFLRVAARLAGQTPCAFAIVGEARFRDAEFEPELRVLSNALGLQDRTFFVPWVDDARTIYAAIDVNCNCSVREPFGRTTVEAAAARVPTVCFDDGGSADVVDDGVSGAVVAAADEEAFAGAVMRLVTDENLRRNSGVAAQAATVRFDPVVHAVRVATVLREAAR
jgi:glycosyltransferase involved in cell wall biosynthesis